MHSRQEERPRDLEHLALEYAAPTLKRDREVVLQAVKKHGEALEYAAPGYALKFAAEINWLEPSDFESFTSFGLALSSIVSFSENCITDSG